MKLIGVYSKGRTPPQFAKEYYDIIDQWKQGNLTIKFQVAKVHKI